ncbi:hypothetical protein Tco_1003755 [Tanacetum coccineum]|uniref:Reverse transcriptase domain-containing protein n=1 Tax=Tanacetum coccineum TaxID=301880 RepID=A0ABQ5FBU3_9ASTR
MHSITNPERIKRLHDNIPKSVDEILRVTTTFLRGEVAASNQARKKTLPTWKQQETERKQNFNRRGDFRNPQRSKRRLGHNTDECMDLKRQIEEMIKAGKLSHVIKELKQGKDQPKTAKKGETSGKDKAMTIQMVQSWQRVATQRITQISPDPEILFPPLGNEDGTEGPKIIEVEIGCHFIHQMYVDGGSASKVLYEHCFNRLRPEVKSQMVLATVPLVGFSGEIIWPMRQISLLTRGEDNSSSPVNSLRNVEDPCSRRNTHSTEQQDNPTRMYDGSESEAQPSDIIQVAKERIKVAIHPEHPEQTIAIGSTLTEEGRKSLCELLRRNLDIFARKLDDMTGVPRHLAEHHLNVREGCSSVRQKKISQAPERNKAIQEVVGKLMDATIMKEVHYHSWLSNPVMVKKHDNSWRMCVYFKDLNKACPKDGYPLPEID